MENGSRCIETAINRGLIEDQVACLIHAFGIVRDNEEISRIDFGSLDQEQVPIKIHFGKPQKEAEFTDYDGS